MRLAEPVSGKPLLIGEGIENAASANAIIRFARLGGTQRPGIKSLGLPERVRDLVIALDNDENGTGQEAALFSRPEMFQHGAGDAG